MLNNLLNDKGVLNYTDYVKDENKDIKFQNIFTDYFTFKKNYQISHILYYYYQPMMILSISINIAYLI